MDTSTILFCFTVINGLIAVANYLGGRKTAGQQEGVIIATLENIKTMISELKIDIKDMKKRNNEFDERITRLETRCDNIQERIDRLENVIQGE